MLLFQQYFPRKKKKIFSEIFTNLGERALLPDQECSFDGKNRITSHLLWTKGQAAAFYMLLHLPVLDSVSPAMEAFCGRGFISTDVGLVFSGLTHLNSSFKRVKHRHRFETHFQETLLLKSPVKPPVKPAQTSVPVA